MVDVLNKMSFQKILICYSPEKDKNGEQSRNLVSIWAERYLVNKIMPYTIDIVSVEDFGFIEKSYDLAISVGGDGTLLRVIHLLNAHNTPVIGVNMGRRGFMTEVDLHKVEDSFKAISEGKCQIKTYPYLYGSVNEEEEFDIAVNDIYVCKSQSLSTVELGLYVDDTLVDSYICDGVLVSTAFGSTAYNRALNGSIVHLDSPVFVITPVGTADSKFKSFVVPKTSRIRIGVIRCNEKGVEVGFDGTQSVLVLKENDVIEIMDNNSSFRMIQLNDFDYYENLRRKLV